MTTRTLSLHLCFALVLFHLSPRALTFNDLGGCRPYGVTYNCSGANFDGVPMAEDLPAGVEVLDLSYNHIYNLTYFDIPEASNTLNKLYLSNNKISIIKPMSFSLLTNLDYLDLSSNMIEGSKLEEHMFHDLRKLKTLILERNPLRIVKKDTFNFIQIPSVSYLDLSHCEIAQLESSSLDLPNLEYLDLSWNKLETISSSSFRMLASLQTLDMSHNVIRTLEEVPFLPEISTWILDNNGIETLKLRDEIWNNADSIKKLSLRNNEIIRFNQEGLPLDLDTLVEIDLSSNLIQCDCRIVFANTVDSEYMNNEIIRFNQESLPLDLDTLVDIDLTGNLVQCDCRMTWIKFEDIPLDGRNITIPCKYPKELRGLNILELSVSELRCEVSLVHVLLLVLLVVVVLLCSGLMFFFLCRKRCPRCRSKTKKVPRSDKGGNYTAVYSKDDDEDVTVEFSDNKRLINEVREFDV